MKRLFIFSFVSMPLLLAAVQVGAMDLNESPIFQEMVAEGALPPVEERLPIGEDIYVVEPVESVGRYGGTARTASTTATAAGSDTLMHTFPNLVKPNAGANEIIPHVAKEVTSSDDSKEWTIRLREGMRWSDGHLFTADDIMFWYEDVLLNEDLTPVIGDPWRAGNQVVEFEKIDDITIKVILPQPEPFFAERLVHMQGSLLWPKHYLKQFHPAYTSESELNDLVAGAGFDHWYQLFGNKNENIWGQPINPERPTLAGYRLAEISSDRRVWEPNPYYWKIDTAGNQLPYLDSITVDIVSDREVVQGMIMSGQLDFEARNTDIQNYPLYRSYEEEGDYRTVLWPTTYGSQLIYKPNMTHQDPVMREIFQDVRFRKALSLALDREEISNMLFFGQAVPRQFTVVDSSRYFEPHFSEAYIDYDPERAMALLDEMGLEKDQEGFRLRPDGERLRFEIEYVEQIVPKAPMNELVVQYWEEIGLDVQTRQISGELSGERAPGNLMDMKPWHGDKTTDVLFPIQAFEFVPISPSWDRTQWPQWELWTQSGGSAGEEPPEEIRQLIDWWTLLMAESDEERQIELAKNILQAQADNLWVIGTVSNVPHPIIVNNALRNFPEEGLWGWDMGAFNMNRDPEQMFFGR